MNLTAFGFFFTPADKYYRIMATCVFLDCCFCCALEDDLSGSWAKPLETSGAGGRPWGARCTLALADLQQLVTTVEVLGSVVWEDIMMLSCFRCLQVLCDSVLPCAYLVCRGKACRSRTQRAKIGFLKNILVGQRKFILGSFIHKQHLWYDNKKQSD